MAYVILKYLQLVYKFYAFTKVTPSAQMDLFKKIISLPAEKNNGKKMNRGTQKEKHTICTDQLSQWDWLRFNVFEGKPWCAMSLSSFLSVSVITVISSKSGQNEKWIQ